MTTILVVLFVLAVLGAIAGGIALLILRGWAKQVLDGNGFSATPVDATKVERFLAQEATFVVTVAREFTHPPDKVWQTLQLNGTFSWIPLFNGIRYAEDYRTEGALRTFDGLLAAVQEQVITAIPRRQLTLTATKVSVPLALKSLVEDYRLTETPSGTTTLRWTIAVRPRLGAFLPLRWAAPLARPFLAYGIKGLSTRL
ncbi:SRPBCC family protein [Nocardia uniformis]|uniref:SRPBCC family protein n=1 Tax=Nocardia uniformis TaxID=53432 RepID=A0A849BXE2_9NOCA|nr:SRPBCC family protein [Nocardia uniformis]